MNTFKISHFLTILLVFIGFLMAVSTALAQVTGSAGMSIGSNTVQPVVCTVLSYNLHYGSTNYSTGGEVSELQTFLGTQGFFPYSPIGVFGPLTFRAVQSFQLSQGIPSTGFVGPFTRAAVERMSCNGMPQPTSNVNIQSITPTFGSIGTIVTIHGYGFTNDNTVHFGTGVVMHVPISSTVDVQCITYPCYSQQTIRFSVPDGLNPACFYSSPRCLVATRQTTSGSYQVYVENSNGTSNAQIFTVTSLSTGGPPQIHSVSPQSARYGQTVTVTGSTLRDGVIHFFQNGQPYGTLGGGTASSDGSRFTFALSEWMGVYCHINAPCIAMAKRLAPGTYTMAIETNDGTTNQISFSISDTSSNQVPTITGLTAPTQLSVGNSGTWTVHTMQSSSYLDAAMQLHYSVVWGDELYAGNSSIMAPWSPAVQSSATFTHAYQRTGTFTPIFTVRNNAGQSASASATVTVTPIY